MIIESIGIFQGTRNFFQNSKNEVLRPKFNIKREYTKYENALVKSFQVVDLSVDSRIYICFSVLSISAFLFVYSVLFRPLLVRSEHLEQVASQDEKVSTFALSFLFFAACVYSSGGLTKAQSGKIKSRIAKQMLLFQGAWDYSQSLQFLMGDLHDVRYFMLYFPPDKKISIEDCHLIKDKGFYPNQFVCGHSAFRLVDQSWMRVNLLDARPREKQWLLRETHLLAADFILYKKFEG